MVFTQKNKPQRKVEISDDYGFSGIFQSMANAAKVCQIPNASTIKYALDRKKIYLDGDQITKNFIFAKY